MNLCFARWLLTLALTAFPLAAALPAVPPPQSNEASCLGNLDAIGKRNVGKGVNFFSLDKETKIGQALAQEVERASRLVDDSLATEYLNSLAHRLTLNSDATFPLTVKILASDIPEELILPGGFLFINKGLILKAETESELAGALAYGIAQTALRSQTQLATNGELVQLASIPATISAPLSWAGYGIYEGMNLAIPLTFFRQQRQFVLAADCLGLQYLYKTGYDPDDLPRLLERISIRLTTIKKTPDALSEFPPLALRLDSMRKEIAKQLPPKDGAIVSSSTFESIRERLYSLKLTDSPSHDSQRPTLRKLPGA